MAEASVGPLIGLYRIAGSAFAPFVPLLLERRAVLGKEDRARIGERQGKPSAERPAGPLVWVHAASVGETNAVLPLVERIGLLGASVLLTTVTVTSAAIAAARLPERARHQFAPVDLAPWVRRFVDHWRPDLALFVESEIWPATISALMVAGVPRILVNARLSERSYRGWKRLGRLARPIFSSIALCLAQGQIDADRFAGLGASDVRVTGNLKFDVPPLPVEAARLDELRRALGSRPVLLGASTHPGEELAIAQAARLLQATFPDLLTIVVPRHPDRGTAIKAEISGLGLGVALRSAGEQPTAASQVYLADTLGELGLFYRLAPVSFVGGSLVPHGGQNPIEPVRLGTAVLHGPHVDNFADIYRTLDAAGGAKAVATVDELAESARLLLGDRTLAERQAKAGLAALAPYSGGLERSLIAMMPFLDRLPLSPAGMVRAAT